MSGSTSEPAGGEPAGGGQVVTGSLVLRTERLTLRPFAAEDAPAVQALAGAREIAETTLNIPHPYPEDGAATWIASHPAGREHGAYPFAMVRGDDGAVMGTIGLHVDDRHRKAELGYWLGVPFWRQGYTTEAARRVIRWGFEELGLNRIFAQYLPRNVASERVMQKAGMKYEGTIREDVLKWGVYEDLGQYALVRSEYARTGGEAMPPGIRVFRETDTDAVARMSQALFPEQGAGEAEREIRACAARRDAGILVAERPDGSVCGFVEVGTRSFANGCDTTPVGYVEAWYVAPDVRRRGIGRALLRAAEGWARERGYREMASDALLENAVSHTAHVRSGYVEVDRIATYRKALIPDQNDT